MAIESTTELRITRRRAADEPSGINLGFTLSFISGRGLLTSRDKRVGPFDVRILEIEIPNIEFPFDVTGGSDRFKTRRCDLRHLAVSLDADGLSSAISAAHVEFGGFLEVRSAIRDGFIQLGGRFAVGEHHADFTMRVAPLIHSPRELSLIFYDTRLYGWLPVPAPLLPVYLQQALQVPFVRVEKAGAWTLTPIEDFLRAVLPRAGWKVPETRTAGLSVAEIARGRITLAAGVGREPNEKQRREREPPAGAVAAGEGIASFARAEESLARGDFLDAYQRYREARDDERGGRWATERLLQIGAADPELALETRQIAEETLATDSSDVQALLAMAAIAMRERAWGEAATRYARLAEISRADNLRYDIVAAELAGADAAAPVDPAAALAGYERAAARARDSIIAHQALFDVRRANRDWDGAAKAGERLVRLLQDPGYSVDIHRQLGVMHRVHRKDLKRARLHFEKALKIEPEDPAALEGLAETYAARGEPARAATYLARLAEHAASGDDPVRTVELNLRLGEIWERWLGDEDNAARRYQTVLDLDPKNRSARLRLAAIAEKVQDWNRARSLYEDLLASEEERGDPEATSDLVQAYTRLARMTLQTDGATPEAIACLERAVELDPSDRPARDELAAVMRKRGEWSRLAQLLDEAARHSTNPAEARRSRLDAARLQLSYGGDPNAARRHLEAILDHNADDPEALGLLIPLLRDGDDAGGLITRLEQAAQVTSEPGRRAEHLVQLAEIREQLGMDPESQRVALEAALDAHPYLLGAAQRLIELLEGHQDAERLVRALGRLSVASSDTRRRAEALITRATLQWRELNQMAAAERSFRRALRLVPGDFEAWNQLAQLYEEQGQYESGRDALGFALAEAEARGLEAAPLYERMGRLAHAAGDLEAEVTALSRAMGSGLRSDSIATRLVEALKELDRGREAAQMLEEWAGESEGSDNDRLVYEAARLRRDLGEDERASHALEGIVDRDGPVAFEAATALAEIAHLRSDTARERSALEYLYLNDQQNRPIHLERLVDVLYRGADFSALEERANELLEIDTRSPTAHLRLSQACEESQRYSEALSHYQNLLLEASHERLDRQECHDAFVHAVGLAREIQPQTVAPLQEAFAFEFPESPPDALERRLGDVLEDEEAWEALYLLRKTQLETVDEEQQRAYQEQIAGLLHHRLGRLEEAIPYYQDVIAGSADPSLARDALVEIYERLERWEDLARHLFAMSQLATSRSAAMDYSLRSARVYGERLGDGSAAQQVLRTMLSDSEEDWRYGGFIDALRDFRLDSELSLLIEKSLEAEPSPDDGRLEELVHLLCNVLNDPKRAADWTERMVERYPEIDEPWLLHARILANFPSIDDSKLWLSRWADAREGQVRARILRELAATHRDDGQFEDEVAILERAAESDPTDTETLELLVERTIAQNQWDATLRWLEQLATVTVDSEERDARWRRLVEVALDYADAPSAAIKGLKQLEAPTEDENGHLLQLYIETSNIEGMQAFAERLRGATLEEQLSAARAAFLADARALARKFFSFVIDAGHEDEVWSEVAPLWTEAGHAEELARWRLQRADEIDAPASHVLRLRAYAELTELGLKVDGLDDAVANADLADLEAAWAVFGIGRAAGRVDWQDYAADVLVESLDENDSRKRSALVFRAERELEDGGDPAKAADMARRLVDLGEPDASRLLEAALGKSGRTDELVSVLEARAQSTDDEETLAALWSRIAELRFNNGDVVAASLDLNRVNAEQRDLAWVELARRVAASLGTDELEIQSDLVHARLATDDAERAKWLRSAGRTALWALGDEERAREWLREAHTLQPERGEEIALELKTLDPEEIESRLAEAFLVLEPKDARPLWLFKFEQARERNSIQDAEIALDALADVTGEAERDVWVYLSERSQAINDVQRQRGFLEKAYAVDRDLEQRYLESVALAGSPDELVAILEKRATELDGEASAERYERAAQIAADQLVDRELALRLLESAVQSQANELNLKRCVQLASELGRTAVVATLGGPLLQRIDADAPDRSVLLRQYVDALDAVGSSIEMEAPLKELIERGQATAGDRARLAGLLEDSEPRLAAELYEESALSAENDGDAAPVLDAAERWFEIGESVRAASLMRNAMERGADDLRAHQLNIQLASGSDRLESISRILDLDGDALWESERRHEARVELGRWKLESGHLDTALGFARAAEQFDRTVAWVELMESIWIALGEGDELATLRVDSIEAGLSPWGDEQKADRLRQSAEHYRSRADASAEYRALDLLSRQVPDDVEAQERLMSVMADLGDRDTFIERVESQWNEQSSAAQRAEVALRYAPVLAQRFEAPAIALDYIRRAYESGPTLRLVESALEYAEQDQVLNEAFEWLSQHADQVEDAEVRLAIDLRLASVAATELDDQVAADRTYSGIFERDPTVEVAREWVLSRLREAEEWSALSVALERSGGALAGEASKAAFLEAAQIVDLHLDDPRRLVALASEALERDPGDRTLATAITERHIALGHLQQARFLLERQRVEPNRALGLLLLLSEALEETGNHDEVESLRALIAERHPESAAAGLYRLERARAAGDARAVLVAAEERIRKVKDLDAAEWLLLHDEAGEAGLSLGDHEGALAHFLAALDTPDPSPDAVRKAAELAFDLRDDDRLDYVLKIAMRMREQITTEAIKSKDDARVRWFTLLGQAHERAEDESAAIDAFRQAYEQSNSERPLAALARLYENKGDWSALLDLERERIASLEGTDRARALVRVAQIQFEKLGDDASGEQSLFDALEFDPSSAEAKFALGLLMMRREEFERGVELLEGQLDITSPQTRLDVLAGYFEGLKRLDRVADAIQVSAVVLERDPMRNDIRQERAKLLELNGQLDESDVVWSEYLERLGPTADAELIVPALVRVARGASRRGALPEAIDYLERAVELDDNRVDLLRELRGAVEASGDHQRAAALYEREANVAPHDGVRTELLRNAARLNRTVDDSRALFRVLSRIHELEPDDVGTLSELVPLAHSLNEDVAFKKLVSDLESKVGFSGLDADILLKLAELAEADDLARAKSIYQELQTRRPKDMEVADRLRDLALATEDYATFVRLEHEAIHRASSDDDRLERFKSLADIALKELKQPSKSAELLASALEMAPDDRQLRRRLADTYALNAASYGEAANLYRSLLDDEPFDVALLRILARLFGQIGDTDRAFGYYAALRTLAPSDDEAKRFVDACRKALLPVPPRPINHTDRGRGMTHPAQLGPVEELFAPLARFAELTHPGNLRNRGIEERDRLAPTDPVAQSLTRALEAIGLAKAELYAWRGGGFACEAELIGKPAILLGSTLLSDASNRQRTFLAVRAGELFRSGHTLCERLSAPQLEALAAAIAIAISPDSNVPGVTTQSHEWARVISAPMNEKIRRDYAPRVHQYIQRFADVDVAAWRRACLATAARSALVVCGDIDEAIAAMLRLRGFDDISDEQRPTVLRESPEELDLWKFALSDGYFKLRASLGVALRSG